MGKGRELSEFDRGRIIGTFQFKHSHNSIATILGIPLGTVKTIIRAFQAGETAPRPRSGRPRKTTPHTDRQIARNVRREILVG